MKNDILTIKTIKNYKKMPDIIADALRDGILRGTLEGGLPLKQDEIAKKFDVSLIPVREALMQLENQGLVMSIRHKGVIVAPLSLNEMKMIFEIRKILEMGAAKIIIDRIEKDQLYQLKSLMTQMEEKMNLYRFNHLNTLFHQILLDSTYNNHLAETYRQILTRAERYCMCILSVSEALDTIKEDHRTIVNYIEEKQYDELSKQLEEHIEKSQEVFISHALHKFDAKELEWNTFFKFE